MTAPKAPTGATVGSLNDLDQSTLMKLQAACGLINAEIRKVRVGIARFGIICLALGTGFFFYLRSQGSPQPALAFVIPAGILAGYAIHEYRQLRKTYKQGTLARIVEALGRGLSYSPESRFGKQDFLDMDLYRRDAEDWAAEDEVSGHKNAVAYSVLEGKATRTESTGKSRRTVTIFEGLVVRLDFNKNFGGHTVVVPNSDSQILGGLFGESESRNSKELCRMDDVAFEEAFSVYSTDQQEARYILTPKLMDLIVAARRKYGDIRCSFRNSAVNVAIPTCDDRFEVTIWSAPITPESAVAELAQVVHLAEGLIDALDLETRIWTKA